MRNALPVLALLAGCAATAAHATGGISCASADGRTRIDVLVSLTQEGVGSGVSGLTLMQRGKPAAWPVTQARADYAKHMLHLVAHAPGDAARVLELDIQQGRGSFASGGLGGHGGRRMRLACDWGEFS